ncbi:MAG: hypothetical protein QOH04_2656 [Sphingomonadales bacterium]|jgi:hypothetical protein|nr:hypothetical protein [Sphingomonadales bacterium]
MVYGSRNSHFKIVFRGGRVVWGPVSEDDLSNFDQLYALQGERAIRLSSRSSDKCLVFGQIILAAPESLDVGRHYECGGSKFTVLWCVKGAAASCERAVISANCAVVVGRKCRTPEPPVQFNGTAIGAPFFMVYDARAGIVNIVLGDDFDRSENHLVLREATGIFGPSWS